MFEMSKTDGTTLQVPTDWAVYMAAVDKKLRQIEESTRLMVNSMHYPNANSTRRDSAEGIRRVTFTDCTTAGRSDENLRKATQINSITSRPDMSGRGLPPPGQRQHFFDGRTPPPTTPLSRRTGLGGIWEGGGSQNQPTILTDSEIRRDARGRSTLGSFEEVNRMMSGGPRDVGQVVHRWGFKFAGDPGESIDTFLERVEENWIPAKLTEGEILTALP